MATVAKSRGLDDRFVATVLQPRCLSWESVVGSWAATGEYVLGRSFGGLTPGGLTPPFTHQIIVPATQANSAVQDMWRMLSASDFSARLGGYAADGGMPGAPHAPSDSGAYSLEGGGVGGGVGTGIGAGVGAGIGAGVGVGALASIAPEIAMLRYDPAGIRLDNCDDALLRQGVNEPLFKAMLRAALEAIPAGRCVYIVSGNKPGRFIDSALALLKHLVASLPFAHRRRLGFLSCAPVPDSADAVAAIANEVREVSEAAAVNLAILPPPVAEHILDGKEYVFDFSKGSFWEPQGGQSLYAECAWADRKRDRHSTYVFFARMMPGASVFDADELSMFSVFARILDAVGAQSVGGGAARGVSAMALYARNRLQVLEATARLLGAAADIPASSVASSSGAVKMMLRDVFSRILDFEESDRRIRPDIGGAVFGGLAYGGLAHGGSAGGSAGSAHANGAHANGAHANGAHAKGGTASDGAQNEWQGAYPSASASAASASAEGGGGLPTAADAAAVLAQVARVAELLHDAGMEARVARLCVDAATYAVGDRFVDELLTRAMESRRVFRLMLAGLLDEAAVLPRFVASRLDSAADVQGIIDEMEMWASNAPALFTDDQVVDAFCGAVERVLMASSDRISDGAELHARMGYTLRNAQADDYGRAVFGCVKAIFERADRSVLEALSGDKVTIDDLSRLRLDSDGLRDDSRYKAATALKAFFCDPEPHAAARAARELRSLGPRLWQSARKAILRMLAPNVGHENYGRIVEAFTHPAQGAAVGLTVGATVGAAAGAAAGARSVALAGDGAGMGMGAGDGANAGAVRFDDMLEFICEEKNRGECCNFIKWAFRNGMFVGPGYADFNNSAVKFFAGFTPKEFNVVQRNFAYLYAGQELSDSEQNLRHILDVFRDRYNKLSAVGNGLRLPTRRERGEGRARSAATVAIAAVVVCAVAAAAFALLSSFFR